MECFICEKDRESTMEFVFDEKDYTLCTECIRKAIRNAVITSEAVLKDQARYERLRYAKKKAQKAVL